MHVLILNSEYQPIGGGAGNASAHIAKALLDEGHQVSVLTSRHANLLKDEIADGIHIIRIPSLRRYPDRSTALEQASFMLSATFIGFAHILKLKPQATLAFFGVPSGFAAWVWSFFIKTPYVVLLRGGDVPGFRPYDFKRIHSLIGPILRLVWKGSAAVVANSKGLKKLGKAFDPHIPIQIIPNGVSHFECTKSRSWSPPKLLFVGRLVYQKGLDILFQALTELKNIAWTLTIVGDGPRKDWLEKKAKELKIADRIHFSAWQPRNKLPDFLNEANIFVYPSRHEGMPNALLEAMAAGLPSIASQIAGNEELIINGENGFLVESENAESLKDALKLLLKDAALRKKMGNSAKKIATSKYTWKAVGQAYHQLLLEITKGKSE